MRRLLPLLLACLTLPATAAEPLRFHYPDSGAPPWLFLAPGGSKPTGVIADVLDATARAQGRTVQYEFQPREAAGTAITRGSADGAMFFSATRPAAKGIVTSEPLLEMDTLLVTLKGKTLGFERAADLKDQRLCTLTEEFYPPLALLAMNGTLLLRKGKTEQAQLMMLRNQDCVAAVMNGPMYRWLSGRYHWDDLRTERTPLLSESLVIGFSPREGAFAEALNRQVKKLRSSGELDRIVSRYLPSASSVTTR